MFGLQRGLNFKLQKFKIYKFKIEDYNNKTILIVNIEKIVINLYY